MTGLVFMSFSYIKYVEKREIRNDQLKDHGNDEMMMMMINYYCSFWISVQIFISSRSNDQHIPKLFALIFLF